MLAWMDSRAVPSKPVMTLCAPAGTLLDLYDDDLAEPWPPDLGWPLP